MEYGFQEYLEKIDETLTSSVKNKPFNSTIIQSQDDK